MNPSEVERWISYAESDLQAAQALLDSEESFPRQICFFAQQSAEKAIKAILESCCHATKGSADLTVPRELLIKLFTKKRN